VLPALAVAGTAVGVKGLTMFRAVGPARALCHFLAAVPAPAFSHETLVSRGRSLSCGPLDSRYHLGLALAVLGFTAAIIAGLGLAQRSRSAAKAGSPWALRRATHAAAEWIDAQLPGERGSHPRLRPGYITFLGTVLAFVTVGAAQSAISDADQSRQLYAYQTAQRTLATLALPSVIHRKSSSGCGGAVCGYSKLTPPQLEPRVARLLDARPDMTLTRLIGCPGRCPITLRGQLQSYPVVADIFWHLVVVRHGHPPIGAIPLPRGHGHLFYLGSDIDIAAVEPSTNT
jgi:hypothetical protein